DSYNNPLDPVTHSKTWIVGTLGLTTGAVIYGAGAASTGVGLEAYFSGLIGGAAAGAAAGTAAGTAGLASLKIQHPFDNYLNNNYKGLSSKIKQWSLDNPDIN
ncbi:MAG: hypothetical protein HON23_03830, partial [Rickettsiales bacterium]|nr:hypothetical protein [Rickettsiales bacterium]